ncbi:MAG: lysylphosphatidylglycerol synthase transmembrane domain-containing protein [Candidatus Sumerlaeaceae bacterium]|jgi:uncharacterized protein (TIRG00374 family)
MIKPTKWKRSGAWRFSNHGRMAWQLLLRMAVSAILLTWIFTRQADLAGALRVLQGAMPSFLALGFALFFVGELLTVYKWQILLRTVGVRCGFLDLTRAMLIGEFYSMFLPTSVGGDVCRIALTRSAAGSTSVAASAALMQRNTGMGGLLVLALVATSFVDTRFGLFSGPLAVFDRLITWFALIALVYMAINIVLLSEKARVLLWCRLAKPAAHLPLLGRLIRFADDFHVATRNMRLVFPAALLLSMLTQFLDCLMGWCAGQAISARLSVAQACVFVPAATLIALLPFSVNGIGLREVAYLTLTSQAGLSKEQAVALGTIHFACLVGLALIGGIWQLLSPAIVARENDKCAGRGADTSAP